MMGLDAQAEINDKAVVSEIKKMAGRTMIHPCLSVIQWQYGILS
jgi:hypothetical protein